MIDCGDHIHHGPSGEDWVVSAVKGEKLYWCGYPFGGYADLSDCTLVKKATDDQRLKLLSELAAMSRAEHLAPVRLAKTRLTPPVPNKSEGYYGR